MTKILKYLGVFCLIAIALSLTFCSVGVYQGIQTANRLFAGADNYTCRQFLYDVEKPETDKLAPLVIATIAYGTTSSTQVDDQRQTDTINLGMEPAVRKVYALCKGNLSERVLNLFTASITGVTTVSSTATPNKNISPTAPATSQ